MTISEESLKKEQIDNSEDTKLLISLLDEYSIKLLDTCGRIDRQNKRNTLTIFCFIIASYTATTIAVIFKNYGVEPIYNHLSFFGIIGAVILISFVLIIIINDWLENMQKRNLLVQDANTISVKLEKVVRLASQTQEHILNNIMSRIELDLRLTDAECAIQYYQGRKRRLKNIFLLLQ
jgi:hypothetical protein